MEQAGGLTFLFTDIEGSTRLVEQLASGWGLTLRTCRRMVTNVFEQHGGREFGSEGDGQFFVFPSAPAAAQAALAARDRVANALWPEGVSLRMRMALHCGPVRISGGEYVGQTVHEVARMCAAANGGQVLCSAAVAETLDDLEARPLGLYELRGIAGARELYEVCPRGATAAPVPPRDATRAGGRRITVWRRDDDGLTTTDAGLGWRALVPDVDVVIDKNDDATLRITVFVGSEVHEEYDGVPRSAMAADVINGVSRLIRIEAG